MRTHNICLYNKVNKKYTGCNLKATEFHECALIGVCAVIRSNTVNVPRKCHNLEAQPSRSTKTRRDDKQTMTKRIPHRKPPTHEQRNKCYIGTALELARSLTLNSEELRMTNICSVRIGSSTSAVKHRSETYISQTLR